jgi:hypothetical protein
MEYEKLKEAIQQANPEIIAIHECDCPSREDVPGRPIRLADVLLVGEDQLWAKNVLDLITLWNLKDDNLDNQSEETKQFLINLLT